LFTKRITESLATHWQPSQQEYLNNFSIRIIETRTVYLIRIKVNIKIATKKISEVIYSFFKEYFFSYARLSGQLIIAISKWTQLSPANYDHLLT